MQALLFFSLLLLVLSKESLIEGVSGHGWTEPREMWGVMQSRIVTVQSVMKHHYYYYHDALEKKYVFFPRQGECRL